MIEVSKNCTVSVEEMTRRGYFLVPRGINNAEIWRENPHVLKLYLFLMGKARHSNYPKRYGDIEVGRGELCSPVLRI